MNMYPWQNFLANHLFPLLIIIGGFVFSFLLRDEARFWDLFLFSLLFLLWMIFVYPFKNILRLTVLFTGFHILYGLAGPFSVIYNNYPGTLIPFMNRQVILSHLNEYLAAYAIASLGLVMAFLLIPRLKSGRDKLLWLNEKLFHYRKTIIFLSFVFLLLALSFELINFYRVGGIGMVAEGKQAYQDAVSNLFLTFPSAETCYLSVLLLGLVLFQYKKGKQKLAILAPYLVLIFPLIALWLSLGYRTQILGVLVAFTISLFYSRNFKFSIKLLSAVAVLYFFSVFLFSARSFIPGLLKDGDLSVFTNGTKKAVKIYILPGANEFGVPYLNFATYLTNPWQLRLGETYSNGMLQLVPRWLYSGEKPINIGTEFSERFSYSSALDLSSVLEAYINFGYWGIFLIYLLLGSLLLLFEKIRNTHTNFLLILLYILLSPHLIYFHRSNSTAIFTEIFFSIILIAMFQLAFWFLRAFRSK
jgi:oligosaccharide repeat unit polymerase